MTWGGKRVGEQQIGLLEDIKSMQIPLTVVDSIKKPTHELLGMSCS